MLEMNKRLIFMTLVLILITAQSQLIPSREMPKAIISIETAASYPVLAAQELPRKNGRRVIELIVNIPAVNELEQTLGFETDRGVYLARKDTDTIKHGWRTVELTLATDNPVVGIGLTVPQIVVRLKTILNPTRPIVVAGRVVEKMKTKEGKWHITIETDQEPPATVGTKAIIEYSSH